jgi:hypothetical protein
MIDPAAWFTDNDAAPIKHDSHQIGIISWYFLYTYEKPQLYCLQMPVASASLIRHQRQQRANASK